MFSSNLEFMLTDLSNDGFRVILGDGEVLTG